jgi:hypothetical protein
MQTDGNLVLYESGVAKWASNTNGTGSGPYSLNLHTDGNLVIYGNGVAIWASNTNGQGLCQLCAYFHDSTAASTSNQIKLAYYDFTSSYYSECYLNGQKNQATTYCCTPTTATIDATKSFDVGNGTRYVKIQIYGDDQAIIGSLNVFDKQLEYFYDSNDNFWGGAGQIIAWNDTKGYAFFYISTGNSIYPVVVTDIDQSYARNGHACYWTYSYGK